MTKSRFLYLHDFCLFSGMFTGVIHTNKKQNYEVIAFTKKGLRILLSRHRTDKAMYRAIDNYERWDNETSKNNL